MEKHTAIITGASQGLGKAIALELAKQGTDLILVALPQSGLLYLGNFLERNFTVKVLCIEADLTQMDAVDFIFNRISEHDMVPNILVNNAGLGNWDWFSDKSLHFYKMQIDLNITNTVCLTRMFLENRSELQSYILNVGSLAARFIVPKKQVYGATKSFISYFTNCLRLEMAHTNISVSLLSPGGINTRPELLEQNQQLTGFARLTILDPDKVARMAVKGMFEKKRHIVPGWANILLLYLDYIIPLRFQEMIIRKRLKSFLGDKRLVP